jgi:hypothetical protein
LVEDSVTETDYNIGQTLKLVIKTVQMKIYFVFGMYYDNDDELTIV